MDLNIFKKKEKKKVEAPKAKKMGDYRPVILVVLDGWGINTNLEGNAIANAKTPTMDKVKGNYPCIALQASGISVGLSWGESGNSEVGHLTMGTGMILYQNLPRINLAIQNGTFFSNEVFQKTLNYCKDNDKALHLLGLVSNGGVHSHIDHLFALLEMAGKANLQKTYIHVVTDGRDTPPKESIRFIKMLDEKIKEVGIGKVASVGGRNWIMDRNKNWDRVKKGYDAMIGATKNKAQDYHEVITHSHKTGVTDEFIEPVSMVDEKNKLVGPVTDGDAILFYNFREDRAKQIAKAFTDPKFKGFTAKKFKTLPFVTMTEYNGSINAAVAFPPQKITNSLGQYLSEKNKKQFHIAETEKYAHVTYFFNGGKEKPFPGEERVLIPSPQVPSYEKTPEMSAGKITDKVIEEIKSKKYDFILINYANPDMLGHTGNLEAAVKGIESVDHCMNRLIETVLAQNGALLVTADHGNAEFMTDPKTGEVITEHSNNPVPCFLITPDNKGQRSETQITRHQSVVDGMLVDISPTILDLMKLPIPPEMVGNSLLTILR